MRRCPIGAPGAKPLNVALTNSTTPASRPAPEPNRNAKPAIWRERITAPTSRAMYRKANTVLPPPQPQPTEQRSPFVQAAPGLPPPRPAAGAFHRARPEAVGGGVERFTDL